MVRLPKYIRKAILSGPIPVVRDWRKLPMVKLTRAEKNMAFVERYCIVPEGSLQGKPLSLELFQQVFFYAVYDNPDRTTDAILSIARKNSKTSTIALIALVHLVGPEARINTEIMSGARSRDQAAQVFRYASKMVLLSPELDKITRVIPSKKRLVGLNRNVEYTASSADATTAHGGSPVVAILDEVGQVRGSRDDFIDAVVTSQGAHDDPLLFSISTQAATDADLFSVWLDDAAKYKIKSTVAHLYASDKDCDIMDRRQWKQSNPALGVFRSERDLKKRAERAMRLPDEENTFRNLFLNQRVSVLSPFLSPLVWESCGGEVADTFEGLPVFGGLDLAECNDLTAFVLIALVDGRWHVKPTFWLPKEGLKERSNRDRVPYDRWHKEGLLEVTPGKSVEYEFVAEHIKRAIKLYDVQQIAFDRYNYRHLRPWLVKAGIDESDIDDKFVEFGQGYKSMSPALRDMESLFLNGKVSHGAHPVLHMCATNAVVVRDDAGNRKLSKSKAVGRIDGMVSLAMALGVAATIEKDEPLTDWETRKVVVL